MTADDPGPPTAGYYPHFDQTLFGPTAEERLHETCRCIASALSRMEPGCSITIERHDPATHSDGRLWTVHSSEVVRQPGF